MRASLLSLLLLLSACGGPTFPREGFEAKLQEVCRKEYALEVTTRRVGSTLYLACDLPGLVGNNLDLNRKVLEKLEGMMLVGTRAALSTDAKVDFLVIKARDARLGSTLTLARYVPDVKWLIYMRISRTDFEGRMVMETTSSAKPEDPSTWPEMTPSIFLARLMASRLWRPFSTNPLVGALLGVTGVDGKVEGADLELVFHQSSFVLPPDKDTLDILREAVGEAARDLLPIYDAKGTIQRVRLGGEKSPWLTLERSDLLAKKTPPQDLDE